MVVYYELSLGILCYNDFREPLNFTKTFNSVRFTLEIKCSMKAIKY